MEFISIREATTNDLDSIVQLFKETVETINAKDYSPEQVKVWSNGASKKDRWAKKINEQHFLVATIEIELAGFGSITSKGYLDFLYISNKHQRKGIAQQLCNALELFATRNNIETITSDVSITAKPFFEKHGFETVTKQLVVIDGVSLVNYKMQKSLK